MIKRKKLKVAINLVTWQAERYLPALFKSIFEQTYNNFSVLVIDNGSSDNTVSYLKEYYPQVKIIVNKNNYGFAKANNQAIHWTDSSYVLCLNQDIILEKDFLKICFDFLEKNENVAAISGKILQWNSLNQQKTNIIDTTGLKVFKSHRVIDRRQNEVDAGQNDKITEIFGISGACAIYRRSALEATRIGMEYFDENFFSYKEDVDLAFRLRLAGCQAFYLPTAIVYHDRTAGGGELTKNREIIKNRRKKSKFINYHSYKNHLFVLVKNEFSSNFFKYFPQIFFDELKKFIYILFFEQKTLKALFEFFKLLPLMLRKRKYIKNNIIKIKANDLNKWYG